MTTDTSERGLERFICKQWMSETVFNRAYDQAGAP